MLPLQSFSRDIGTFLLQTLFIEFWPRGFVKVVKNNTTGFFLQHAVVLRLFILEVRINSYFLSLTLTLVLENPAKIHNSAIGFSSLNVKINKITVKISVGQ